MMKIIFLVMCQVVSLSIGSAWVLHGLDSAYRRSVLSHARGIAEVFAEMRQVYAEHRSETDSLPITFARILSKRITTARVRIYSPYPFPSNKSGGLTDDFERQAWDRLAKHDDVEFMSWKFGMLRYTIPDRMTDKCVACHNSAPDTPKSDWKVGDVRGIIEVEIPY